ncbi:hypothetical protein KAW65_09225 [candidate division WOR-3 bacterium]|nr:hypothetical protein [candidate division WOR-3 bacterium]
MNKRFFYLSGVSGLIILIILITGCAGRGGRKKILKIEEIKPIKNTIEIEAKGEVLDYREESFWNEESFSLILRAKEKFRFREIGFFKEKLESHNKDILELKMGLNEAFKSTFLSCYIKGAKYGSNSYEFHWLLAELPFDLFQFQRSLNELNYEGKVNGISTTIRLIFRYRLNHSNEYVWRAK